MTSCCWKRTILYNWQTDFQPASLSWRGQRYILDYTRDCIGRWYWRFKKEHWIGSEWLHKVPMFHVSSHIMSYLEKEAMLRSIMKFGEMLSLLCHLLILAQRQSLDSLAFAVVTKTPFLAPLCLRNSFLNSVRQTFLDFNRLLYTNIMLTLWSSCKYELWSKLVFPRM